MVKSKLFFFIGHINDIGGVEQWIYYISKKYSKDYDIALLYKCGEAKQLKRLRKLIKCVEYHGENVECEKIIFCYDLSIIDMVKAKEYILTIHADYKAQNLKISIPKQITSVYCVSEQALNAFVETHGNQLKTLNLKPKVLYNPLCLDEPKKVLRLVSATRLTPEKGGERIKEVAKQLHYARIPFIWLVFTKDDIKSDIEELVYMSPKLNIVDYIKEADYLVQLSDTEGYSYSIVESLALGTPVIVTNFPVTKEIGIIDGENGYILDMKLSNLDVDKIYNKIPNGFKYIAKQSEREWNKLFGDKSKSSYVYDEDDDVSSYISQYEFQDTVINKFIKLNTNINQKYKEQNVKLTQKRIDHLIGLNLIKEE